MFQMDTNHYLGLDLSTQQLKAVVVDDALKVVCEATVQFDNDLPEYRTQNGVNRQKDRLTVTAPPVMWAKALDMLLERLKVAGLDLASITSVSGSAQQHASVYWKKGASQLVSNLDHGKFLHEQLECAFSIRDSPVWMDSSTETQCRALQDSLGGAQKLADITGSRAFERFTGNQIAKLVQTKPEAYQATERISLASSFLATIFLGQYAAIDYSDASGMNLLDIASKQWHQKCLSACAPGLEERLGEPVESGCVLGTISSYFVHRYGFPADCAVVAFTGDNPASLVGMTLSEGDIVVSLGTSDTVLMWLNEANPSLEGHIMVNPVNPSAFMGMLCFKNGSLTRERIKDDCADGSWDIFSQILDSTPRGNFGNIGMFYDHKEILPPLIGDFKFNKDGDRVSKFSQEVKVRAVIEGQFLAKRVHAERLGFKRSGKVLVTGGASRNTAIVQVLSDVFGARVYVNEEASANAACLGAAFMATYGKKRKTDPQITFEEMVQGRRQAMREVAKPSADAEAIYGPMAERYWIIEKGLRCEQGDTCR
ncbi:xylulose kinase-like [Ornithodoros turicata]|uniref:xylulose kinase-like n=1 Tax=Ornithodoros turicata TaxID=34597 RepID=UPI00313A4D3C